MVDWQKARARCRDIFISQFLLISFFVTATIALAWPAPGKAVAGVEFFVNGRAYQVIKLLNIMIVFLISGAMLKTNDLKQAWKYKLGVLYGFAATLAITPCLGFAFRTISLTPDEFTAGLTLTTAVPQTLGIGISLVRSCGGNEGLALILTAGTNILGIFTMPLWLKALLSGTDFNLAIDMVSLLVNLIISVLVPSLVGKAIREFVPGAAAFVTRHKVPLSLFSTANLAFIIWMVLSSAQSVLMDQPFVSIVYVMLLSSAQHILYLAFNFTATTLGFRMPPPENIATAIMASQKSGPVAVAVIGFITNDVSQQGLLAIPAVMGQLVQVLIGSALVPFFSRITRAHLRAQQVAAEEAQEAGEAEALESGTSKAEPDLAAAGKADVSSIGDSKLGAPAPSAAMQSMVATAGSNHSSGVNSHLATASDASHTPPD